MEKLGHKHLPHETIALTTHQKEVVEGFSNQSNLDQFFGTPHYGPHEKVVIIPALKALDIEDELPL